MVWRIQSSYSVAPATWGEGAENLAQNCLPVTRYGSNEDMFYQNTFIVGSQRPLTISHGIEFTYIQYNPWFCRFLTDIPFYRKISQYLQIKKSLLNS